MVILSGTARLGAGIGSKWVADAPPAVSVGSDANNRQCLRQRSSGHSASPGRRMRARKTAFCGHARSVVDLTRQLRFAGQSAPVRARTIHEGPFFHAEH